ncbi:uncharacterized protein [Periplaneta americana]|uniref:uncharacterized protein n=1 Tax=Periplaneta americana TaxID=6978 RepID=UPI0037E75C0B
MGSCIPQEERDLFKSRWDEFRINGRHIFLKSCLVMAKARFKKEEVVWSKSPPGDHAEVETLCKLYAMEQNCGSPKSIELYLSYSPCVECAQIILEFSKLHPGCRISLLFSCIYRHRKFFHCEGLRRLNASPYITLRVFNSDEWNVLAQATGIPISNYTPETEIWDMYWQSKLDSILSKNVGFLSYFGEDTEEDVYREEEEDTEAGEYTEDEEATEGRKYGEVDSGTEEGKYTEEEDYTEDEESTEEEGETEEGEYTEEEDYTEESEYTEEEEDTEESEYTEEED